METPYRLVSSQLLDGVGESEYGNRPETAIISYESMSI